jgi:hypothetical protein
LFVSTLTAFLSSCTTSVSPADEEQEIMEMMNTFLRAFENGNLEVMEKSFSDNAFTFPRAIMSNEVRPSIKTGDYRRVTGLDPQMRQLIARWRESSDSPPYMTLTPKDLELQFYTDTAVLTFHLEYGNALGRRTFFLAKEHGSWTIVHLHASNVVGSE